MDTSCPPIASMFSLLLYCAGRASPPYNQMHDSPPYGGPYSNGMPPGGGPPGGIDRPAGFPQHHMPPQGFIPPEASGGMPAYMGGGFRPPPGVAPHLRLPPPGPLSAPQQQKRPGMAMSVTTQEIPRANKHSLTMHEGHKLIGARSSRCSSRQRSYKQAYNGLWTCYIYG